MKRITVVVLTVIMLAGFTAQAAPGGQTITAVRTNEVPVVDGSGADKAWNSAPRVVTHDNVADIDISLQAVHTGTDIYFLVTFPDKDESRMHKSWVWDKEKKIYTQGNDREDVFVFKWNMGSKRVDLSLTSDDMYEADIWYWKAVRTDPAGYADDKMHHIITENIKDAAKLTSKKGITRYLIRPGDVGTPAFKSTLQIEYAGDVVPRFSHVTPSGSAGDVKAKGQWKDGM
ncbi:MAG: hypothetical protein JSU90_07525, partial [Nitrospiraceae bacterium]